MRLRSFTTVAIRLMGLMSIFYGVLMVIFMLMTYVMLSDGRMGMSGMGSMLFFQFLLPGLMIVFGIVLIVASPALGDSLSRGLEE
jgi:hypothetical protein